MWAAPAAFNPSPQKWAGLEKALGAKLSSHQREAITRLTAGLKSDPLSGYFSRAAAERSSSKMIDAKEWLDGAKSVSNQMAKTFTSAPPRGKHHATNAARARVYARLNQILMANGYTGPIDEIFSILPAAVEATIRDVDSLESKSRSGGAAWRDWVTDLNAFFAEEGLPTTVRKDALGSAGFVHFLAAIQKLFPAALREHEPKEEDGHLDAMAGATNRALTRKNKLPETSQ
jgi:hypothetical protein